jgi:alpha-beta hydrolase superfamily lysophospholipase
VSRVPTKAFFLDRDEHSSCLLFSPPAGLPRAGAVVHVPAFAEEMNKSRRAVANAARAMAGRGWQVLVFDLHGTGDSSGDFGDATWSGWLEDLRAAIGWLREHAASEPVLWGLRSGCLLINDVLPQIDCSNDLLATDAGREAALHSSSDCAPSASLATRTDPRNRPRACWKHSKAVPHWRLPATCLNRCSPFRCDKRDSAASAMRVSELPGWK